MGEGSQATIMTIEPEAPQVVELEAEDVTLAPKPQKKSRANLFLLAVAVIIAGLAGGWGYTQVRSMVARIDQLDAVTKDTSAEARGAAGQAQQAQAALDATSSETVRLISEANTALVERIAATEQALQSTKAELGSLRSAATSSNGAGVDPTALVAIGQRLDTLEKDVASLKGASSATTELSQALSDIKTKIAAGTPYSDELSRITRLAPAISGLATTDHLAAHAAEGLPVATSLAQELRAAIPSLPQPAAIAAESSGWWDALTAIVTIRSIGESNWPVVAEDAAKLAETGDLTGAITRLDRAEGPLPTPLSQWRDRAAARITLEAAILELAKVVESQITAGATP